MDEKNEVKMTKITHLRLSELEMKRLALLAGERQWTMSHLLRFIVESYTDTIFEKNTLDYKR